MIDRDKVFDAFRNCITEPKCRDCPWEQCEQFNQKKTEIPITLALDVIELLKEQGKTVKATRNNSDGVWACGACGHPVFPSLLERYCPGCGKKVDYNE